MTGDLETLGELVALYRQPEAQRAVEYTSPFLAAAICRDVARFRRLHAAATAEGLDVPVPIDVQVAEALLHEEPRVLEDALASVGPDAMVEAMRRYIDKHPLGDDEDRGFRVLFDYDCVHLLVSVVAEAKTPLSAGARDRLRAIQHALYHMFDLVRQSPGAFRRFARVLAGYCERWSVEVDHPMSFVVDVSAPWVEGLLAHRALLEASEGAAATASAPADVTSTMRQTFGVLRGAIGQGARIPGLLAALKDVLTHVGRSLVLPEVSMFPPPVPLGVSAAGQEAPEALARSVTYEEGGVKVRLVRSGERVTASPDVSGPVGAGCVVTLLEADDEPRELASAVTDVHGEADLGPIEPLRAIFSYEESRRYRIKLLMPADDEDVHE